jgi:glycosyltransferase involved in cell wall biosynthesis
MRVLHFAESYHGGIASYLNELLPRQGAAYDSISVLVPEKQDTLIQHHDRLKIHTYPPSRRRLDSLLGVRSHLQGHLQANRYDIVHLHSSFAGAIGRSVRSSGAAIVYCPHGWAQGMRTSAPARAAYRMVENVLSRRTGAIINISHSEERHARAARVALDKCHLVHNGISDAPFTPLPAGTRLKRLLFVGRYDRQKGADLLVGIAPSLRERGITLTMIGGAVIGKPAVANIPEDVDHRGWQPPDAVAAAMNEADAIIMPSRWEGFGLVAVEAMRAARPIVATEVGGLAEIVVHGCSGILVPPESPAALLNGVDRLAGMDLREMGLNGRKRYEELYTADLMFSRTDQVYRKLMDTRT